MGRDIVPTDQEAKPFWSLLRGPLDPPAARGSSLASPDYLCDGFRFTTGRSKAGAGIFLSE